MPSDNYLITAEHLWNLQSIFIKQIKKGWRLPAPAGPELAAVHTFQGSPQAQANFPSRPLGFWGVEWDWNEDEKIKHCRVPTSDGLAAKRKLMELGSFGP